MREGKAVGLALATAGVPPKGFHISLYALAPDGVESVSMPLLELGDGALLVTDDLNGAIYRIACQAD